MPNSIKYKKYARLLYAPIGAEMGAKAVKKVLIDKGWTTSELAEKTGFSRGHLYGVLSGRYKSERAKKIIALALGKEFGELWGIEQEDASTKRD
jgi:lambda repressor-like predicted transcriptional regulator